MTRKEFKFSNFQALQIPIVYQNITYNTVENFYQAMKTNDIQARKNIASVSPSIAKRIGKSITIRKDWNAIKVDVMRYALKIKFQKGTSILKELLETEGPIIEYNTWHDTFWGVCICTTTNGKYGNRGCKGGLNHLGKILEEIRNENRY